MASIGAAFRCLKSNGIEYRMEPGSAAMCWGMIPKSGNRFSGNHAKRRKRLYLKEPLGWNHALGFGFIAAGAFFIFHKWS
jgi:hypothetical protein